MDLTPEDTLKLMEHWRKVDAKEKSDFVDVQLQRAVDAVKVALLVEKK